MGNLQDLCEKHGYISDLSGFKKIFFTGQMKIKEIYIEISIDNVLLLRSAEKNINISINTYDEEYLTFYKGKSKTHIINVPCNEIKECVSKKFSDTVIEYVFNFKNVTYRILVSM